MAMLQFFKRSIGVGKLVGESYPLPQTRPIASYTTIETVTLFPVEVGELIGYGFARVTTIFNGSGTTAVLIIGDDGDTNRFFEDGDIDEATVGNYRGLGVGLDNAHLYTTANTIDVLFTDDTGNDGTEGVFNVWFYIARVFPQ